VIIRRFQLNAMVAVALIGLGYIIIGWTPYALWGGALVILGATLGLVFMFQLARALEAQRSGSGMASEK
jgi:hypothetical protein